MMREMTDQDLETRITVEYEHPVGWWVKDQHGSFYEGPYDDHALALNRASMLRKELNDASNRRQDI